MLTAALTLVGGCSAPEAPISERALIGEYVYRSAEGESGHEADRLILTADMRYSLVGEVRGVTSQSGTWYVIIKPHADLVLERSGFPIEVSGAKIKLHINDDLGQWYEKVK